MRLASGFVRTVVLTFAFLTAVPAHRCLSQDNMPSFFTSVLGPDTTAPVHKYSLNMAALGRINGVTEGFGVVLFRHAGGCEHNGAARFHSVPFLFA